MTQTDEKAHKSIAVFDVGKTNKKLIVFNHRLELIDAVYHTFNEYEKDGVYIEAVEEAAEWLRVSLREMAARHDIGAISICTHGAAFACIDADGRLAVPLLSYTTDPGELFNKRFAADFGDPITLQRETKTPNMVGLGCMAKGIRFAQERWPEAFKNTAAILALPQYYGFLLTGNKAIDPTNVGCHTAFWNFEKNDWSPVITKMGIRSLFPRSISAPWDVLGTITPDLAQRTGLSGDTVVTVGIHDSNASLLPYLVKETGAFVVNSTGTVSVSLCPTKDTALTEEELGKIVYYNLSAFKTPVKTAIFLGGMEFDTYLGLLTSVHGAQGAPCARSRPHRGGPDRKALLCPAVLYPVWDVPGFPRPDHRGRHGDTDGRALRRHAPRLLQRLHKGLHDPRALGCPAGRGRAEGRGAEGRDAAIHRGGVCEKRDLHESCRRPLSETGDGHDRI